ncbi:MAG: ribonuclease P protein component [Firmicutes bacterium]|nr:ribonuclease P protein component [Bacillota bacterium]
MDSGRLTLPDPLGTGRATLKGHRLRRNKDFRVVFHRGQSVANRYFVLYVSKKENAVTRAGFSVSKKVGNAVVRNRIKRLLREVLRKQINQFGTGYDLIVIARKEAYGLTYVDVERQVQQLLRRSKLL